MVFKYLYVLVHWMKVALALEGLKLLLLTLSRKYIIASGPYNSWISGDQVIHTLIEEHTACNVCKSEKLRFQFHFIILTQDCFREEWGKRVKCRL